MSKASKRAAITVADLEDQLGQRGPRAILYCAQCGAKGSAHGGDYRNLPKDHVFRCCQRNMRLALEVTSYREVRP